MKNQQTQSFTRLAVAIIVAGAVIGTGIFASSYLGTSRTVTKIIIQATSGTSQLYQVEFSQESNCWYGSWFIPWAVDLDGQTVVQPSNATLPLSFNGGPSTGDSNYSAIWFSLPNGIYNYTILPNDPLGSHQSGNVTVDGSDVTVQVYAFVEAMGCPTRSSSG